MIIPTSLINDRRCARIDLGIRQSSTTPKTSTEGMPCVPGNTAIRPIARVAIEIWSAMLDDAPGRTSTYDEKLRTGTGYTEFETLGPTVTILG